MTIIAAGVSIAATQMQGLQTGGPNNGKPWADQATHASDLLQQERRGQQQNLQKRTFK
jgi:hypothetical protein